MTSIPRVSLEETLMLVQLVRETALAKGREDQASRLAPVTEKMHELVAETRRTKGSGGPSTPAAASGSSTAAGSSIAAASAAAASAAAASTPPAPGILGQADFRTLLSVSQARAEVQVLSAPQPGASSVGSIVERNMLIGAMAEASMSEIEIARQFAMTQEEVRLVLSIQQKGAGPREIGQ